MHWAVHGLAVLAVACGGLGCRSLPRGPQYDVTVKLGDSLTDAAGVPASVEVHVVALDYVKGLVLQNTSMTRYWDPNRRPDDSLKRVMHFGPGQPASQSLPKNDPIWTEWTKAGAAHLFVLADLPKVVADKPDVADPRRLILPLDRSRWTQNTLPIVVEADGVFCLTPLLPRRK